MLETVLPMFSSPSFIVSALTFRSLIHFEFIFVYGVRKCSSFILLQVVNQRKQHLKSILGIDNPGLFSGNIPSSEEMRFQGKGW